MVYERNLKRASWFLLVTLTQWVIGVAATQSLKALGGIAPTQMLWAIVTVWGLVIVGGICIIGLLISKSDDRKRAGETENPTSTGKPSPESPTPVQPPPLVPQSIVILKAKADFTHFVGGDTGYFDVILTIRNASARQVKVSGIKGRFQFGETLLPQPLEFVQSSEYFESGGQIEPQWDGKVRIRQWLPNSRRIPASRQMVFGASGCALVVADGVSTVDVLLFPEFVFVEVPEGSGAWYAAIC